MNKQQLRIELAKFEIPLSMINYDSKIIAFVKFEVNGTQKWLHFIVDKGGDLQAFIDRLLNPRIVHPNWSLTNYTYKFTAFHEKTKGDKTFSMANNPKYLISHSNKKGWFRKEEAAKF